MHDGIMQYEYDRPDLRSRSRSRAHESRKFDHFQGLSPPPFIMGLANDHGFLN